MSRDKRYVATSIGITLLTIAAIVLSACSQTADGTFLIDHDGDPNTAPLEMTQAQRCTFYNARIELIDSKPPPMNEYDTYARTGYTTARSMAGCPVVPTE